MKKILKIYFVLFLFSTTIYYSNTNGKYLGSQDQNKLVSVCKLWGAIKFLHPYLGYKEIDWDKALIDFLKSNYRIGDDKEMIKKIQVLLEPLNDPVTKAIIKRNELEKTTSSRPSTSQVYKLIPENKLIIKIKSRTSIEKLIQNRNLFKEMVKKCEEAQGVIFDLRTDDHIDKITISNFNSLLLQSEIFSKLFSGKILSPCERYRMHWGYPPEFSSTKSGFSSSFSVHPPTRFRGARKEINKPIVFLVNERSLIPLIALALQTEGKAAIVAENGVNEASVVRTINVNLTKNIFVRIRASELVNTSGTFGVKPTILVKKTEQETKDIALSKALDLLKNFIIPKRTIKATIQLPKLPKVKLYGRSKFPVVEYRLLAIFKVWNIIDLFFPYKNLMERDWEDVLREYIPRIIQVKNHTDYALTVSEMLAHLHDSHVDVNGQTINNYFGNASQPFICRMIENQVVITDIPVKGITKECMINVGDIILEVDGENIKKRILRFSKYISASTPQSKIQKIISILFRGAEDSILKLTIKKHTGKIEEVKLSRKEQYNWIERTYSEIKTYRKVTDDIGYADLNRLTKSMVDDMFETFKQTKAIIFDMRGYPNGTAWEIAPRLTKTDPTVGAHIRGRLVIPPEWSEYSSTEFQYDQVIRKSKKWKYNGKTVMLIDEQAYSQAEHTGLFLEAANNTIFIGSPTAGVNGNVTHFFIPGNLFITFSGKGITFADRRQLQRKGLQPYIFVRPTIKGIRQGRDEVLENAIEYLKNLK